MGILLWIVAVILVVAGVVNLLQGEILWGLVLLIVGFGVGPGGFTFFKSRSRARTG